MLAPEDIKKWINTKAEAVQIIRTGIDNDIYSIINACPNSMEMWKAIERSQAATKNRDKAITNSPPLTYDPEPKVVADDDASLKEKEIDKLLMTLQQSPMSFQENLYKPNLNATHCIRENVGTQVVQQTGIQCYNCKEFGHVSKECKKPKRAQDFAYHKRRCFCHIYNEHGEQEYQEALYNDAVQTLRTYSFAVEDYKIGAVTTLVGSRNNKPISSGMASIEWKYDQEISWYQGLLGSKLKYAALFWEDAADLIGVISAPVRPIFKHVDTKSVSWSCGWPSAVECGRLINVKKNEVS
ncbi:retrovirus-related pol polyprotein from transposon TNT 1-94 [Tanacetum coccineum]